MQAVSDFQGDWRVLESEKNAKSPIDRGNRYIRKSTKSESKDRW